MAIFIIDPHPHVEGSAPTVDTECAQLRPTQRRTDADHITEWDEEDSPTSPTCGSSAARIATNTAIDVLLREPKPPVELDDNNDMLLSRGLASLLDEEEVGPLHERVGVALGRMEYDCRIFLLAGFVYGIAPVEIARIARSTLSPEGRQTPMASRVQEWFQNLIGPLEKQSTDRRNYCLSKLKDSLQKGSSGISKKGTKRESRGGTTQPSHK